MIRKLMPIDSHRFTGNKLRKIEYPLLTSLNILYFFGNREGRRVESIMTLCNKHKDSFETS